MAILAGDPGLFLFPPELFTTNWCAKCQPSLLPGIFQPSPAFPLLLPGRCATPGAHRASPAGARLSTRPQRLAGVRLRLPRPSVRPAVTPSGQPEPRPRRSLGTPTASLPGRELATHSARRGCILALVLVRRRGRTSERPAGRTKPGPKLEGEFPVVSCCVFNSAGWKREGGTS